MKPAPSGSGAPSVPRYVELIRVSSQGQADRNTPADQRRDMDRMRLAVPGVFVDRIDTTISGATDMADRPDLARLAELAEARAFTEVRVRHLDRLTRHDDPLERAMVLAIVRRAGAVIRDASGSLLDPRTMAGELTWVFATLSSAEERRKIAERTAAGKARRAAEGRLVHGRPPFARTWDRKAGTWGIDEAKAAVYQRIFADVLAGSSTRTIAAKLEAARVPSPLKGSWCAARISHLVHDPAAWGHYQTHGHTFTILPIVNKATADAAIARLAANSSLRGPRPTVFALVRKIAVCAECGSTMYVDKGGAKDHPAHYYVCSSSDCEARRFHRIDLVDAEVTAKLRAWVEHPKTLLEAASLDAPEDAREGAERTIAEAEAELRDLDRQEERIARLFRRGQITTKTNDKQLAEIAKLRADADAQVSAAHTRLAAVERLAEVAASIAAKVEALRADMARAIPDKWRELALIVFPRGGVKLYPDGQIELDGLLPLDAPVALNSSDASRAA